MQLRHVGIVCEDIEKSVKFYSDWFGCTIARAMDESGRFISTILSHDDVEVRTVKLNFPNGESQLELLSFATPEMQESEVRLISTGLTHFALKVITLDRIYEKMLADGVVFLSPPKISDDGCAKVCFCRDPSGVYIELVEMINA